MSVGAGAVRAGEAYVEIAVKDTTAAGVQSALRNYARLQGAAEQATQATSRVARGADGQWMLSRGNGRLVQTSQRGLVLPARSQLGSGYDLAPIGNVMAERASRMQARNSRMDALTGRDVGFLPQIVQRNATAYEKVLKDSTASIGGELIEEMGGRFAKVFLGITAMVGTLRSVFRSVGDAIEAKLKNPAIDFADAMAKGYAEAFDTVPIVGQIARTLRLIVLDNMGQGVDERSSLREAERTTRIVAENERKAAFSTGTREAEREIAARAVEKAIAEVGMGPSRVFSREGLIAQGDAARADADAAIAAIDLQASRAKAETERRIKDEAAAAGLLTEDVGLDFAGSTVLRANPEVQRRIDAEQGAIEQDAEARRIAVRQAAEQRLMSLKNSLDREAEAEQERMIAAAAAKESLILDQQDRRRMLAIDKERIAVSGKDDLASRTRLAQLDGDEMLLRLQQQLDEKELSILEQTALTLQERQSLIEEERLLAAEEASNIRASVAAAVEEAGKEVEKSRKSSLELGSGTFSAVAASRNGTSTLALQREANRFLATIAGNTAQGLAFGA